MTNYQELKRLAEAAKLELADIANVVIEDGDLSHHELFQSLASPDVVLGLIKSLEHTTMAAEAEAKEVDERNAVIAGLRTQNQALMEALERMVESVTGVDQVSAVDEARAALTAAQQAQPPAPSEAAREYMTGYSDAKEWAGATNQAQQAQSVPEPVLQWCDKCGEGTVQGLCRGKLDDCKFKQAQPEAGVQSILDEMAEDEQLLMDRDMGDS